MAVKMTVRDLLHRLSSYDAGAVVENDEGQALVRVTGVHVLESGKLACVSLHFQPKETLTKRTEKELLYDDPGG